MAGMLPGVEAARRRRIHNNYDSPSSLTSRLPSLCLYATTTHQSLSKSSMREYPARQKGLYDESMHLALSVAATEAKTRLDHRFQSQSTSQTNRSRSSENLPKLKKYGGKKLRWLKLKWNSSYRCTSC